MNRDAVCPVCQSFAHRESVTTGSYDEVECEVCGRYKVADETIKAHLRPTDNNLNGLTMVERAIVARYLMNRPSGDELFMITLNGLKDILSEGHLPSHAVQAVNLIRHIGDEISRTGEPIDQFQVSVKETYKIGTWSPELLSQLIEELSQGENIWIKTGQVSRIHGKALHFLNVNLTLNGWEQYEAEKRGKFDGKYGFIAMQFNDDELETFAQDVVKPAVKDAVGYDLVDMRNVAQAGVIDNIMRIRIRDSAFVIADLTHDNRGAYWEAGYAEGLGKPVIYICEKEKFDKEKPHFDTNHCTTILWSKDEKDGFREQLIATLRRSLSL